MRKLEDVIKSRNYLFIKGDCNMKFSKLLMGGLVAASIGMVAVTTPVHAAAYESTTAGDSTAPRMDFVDISSWNPNLSVSDFQTMKKYGVTGVIVKLTEHTTYVNPYARQQIANAQAAGLKIGVYHYAHFTDSGSAVTEANYFANQAANLGLSKSVVMVDDLEDSSTKTGNVTNNALAFRNRLNDLGYNNQMLYTYASYSSEMGMNLSSFGNRNVWMASYPYNPNKNDLWYGSYGAWQWNSNTTFPGVSGVFDVSIDYGSPMKGDSFTGFRGDVYYVNGKKASGYYDGGRGWRWYENGVPFDGFRFYMGTYYWFGNGGIRQDNGWREAWGLKYYTDSNGRAVQGVRSIGGKKYFFGTDGTFYLRKNGIVSNQAEKYKADGNGVLAPWSGFMDMGAGWKWYENGSYFTGFRFYMGSYYWFQNGQRQNNSWENAWGLRYYVGNDGRAVQGWQTIDGKKYYFGDNGTFFLR